MTLTRLLVLLAGLSWLPAQADTHALLMAIADYPSPHQLPGVKSDLVLGKKLAHWMKVPEHRITVIQDGSLKADGFRQTLATFAASVRPGDDVFVYYSGHGGRRVKREGGGASAQCEEAFVAADLQYVMNDEFKTWLEAVSAKANKVIVFADACHSGGMVADAPAVTRSLRDAQLKPKFMVKGDSAGPADCQPVNLAKAVILTRTVKSNAVYLAAAQDNEVAWATPRGSTASMAWTSCLEQPGLDTDGSGGVTVDELQRCAQSWLDSRGYNQHLRAVGNTQAVLGFEAKAPVPASVPAALPTPVPAVAPAVGHPLAAMLDNLAANGDPKQAVSVVPVRAEVTIGRDTVDFDITTPVAGYLYLLYLGSDGKTVDLLFPNKLDPDNQLAAGTHRFPRPTWRLKAGGPAGTDRLVAIVSPVRRNFAQLAAGQVGPFSLLVDANTATAVTTRNLMVEALRPAAADCGAQGCDQSYGVGQAEIREVP